MDNDSLVQSLSKVDKISLCWYDFAASAVDNLFNNLESYSAELSEFLSKEDIQLIREIQFDENYNIEAAPTNVKFLLTIQSMVSSWMEQARDDLISSVIDSYSTNN